MPVRWPAPPETHFHTEFADYRPAFATARIVGRFLTVSGKDPMTYIEVTDALTLIAFTASFIPAWRATRVELLIALRYE